MGPMPPWKRRRSYFVRGRLRVPFEGYQRVRRASTSEAGASDEAATYPVGRFGLGNGLTPAQAWQVRQLLNRAQQKRGRLRGPLLAARVAGIISAVKGSRVGNSAWGWSMHGKRGGQVMARHALYKLREISPVGTRASVIARRQWKAREAFERDRARGGPVLPPPQRPRSFLGS